MHLLSEDIKKIVESTGLVSEQDYLASEEEAVRSNHSVLDILIGKGFIDEKYLAGSIKESVGIAGAVDISKMIEAVPIVNIVSTIIEHAATLGASDIHLKSMGIKVKMPETIYQGEGCGACGFSGYRGQIGLFEVLYVSDTIRELVIAKAATNIIKDKARAEGMKLMFEDGLEKIEAGQTTLEEVLRVAVE